MLTRRSLASRAATLFSALVLLSAAGHAQTPREQLRAALDGLFDAPAWRNAHWGVKVVDLATSEVLYAREEGKGFMPASNLKLYTTAAALKLLGPESRFETRIYANGPVSSAGVLRGDLVVVGSGDPSISGRYNPNDPSKPADTPTTAILRQWAQAVRKAGIREVTGAVIGDDNCFDDQERAGSWQLDYYQDWYAAESSGLAVNENCYDFVITPGRRVGEPARVAIELPTRYLTVRNELITTGPRGKTEEDPPLSWSRPLDGNEIVFKGFMPIDMPRYKHWASVHNGTLYAVTLFAEALRREGVRVRGGARDIDDLKNAATRIRPDRLRLLHTHLSPPVAKLVKIVNKPSQNFYADQLLKALGHRFRGQGGFDTGERVVRDFLTSAGIAAAGFNMSDGSGLSRQNLVQPQMTAGLLTYLAGQPEFPIYYDSLPIAGVDGTIRRRMVNTPAQNNCHAKTGFIGRVRALSGYVNNKDGHRIVFTMMANNYTVATQQANDVQDKVVVMLASYSDTAPFEPPVADTATTDSLTTKPAGGALP